MCKSLPCNHRRCALELIQTTEPIAGIAQIRKRGVNAEALTPLGSQMRIVRSLEAVYKAPFPPMPPPPHRTTFTLAEWPPSAYSNLLVALDQTRTLPSFEEDASRGAVGFLGKPKRTGSIGRFLIARKPVKSEEEVSPEMTDILINLSGCLPKHGVQNEKNSNGQRQKLWSTRAKAVENRSDGE